MMPTLPMLLVISVLQAQPESRTVPASRASSSRSWSCSFGRAHTAAFTVGTSRPVQRETGELHRRGRCQSARISRRLGPELRVPVELRSSSRLSARFSWSTPRRTSSLRPCLRRLAEAGERTGEAVAHRSAGSPSGASCDAPLQGLDNRRRQRLAPCRIVRRRRAIKPGRAGDSAVQPDARFLQAVCRFGWRAQ